MADGSFLVNTPDRDLIMSRVFEAPRALVWLAWTKPEHLVRWWGPNGFTTTIETFDLRVGGHWKFVMHGPDGTDYPNHSVFTEILAPERIVFEHGGGREGAPEVNFRMNWIFEALSETMTRLTIHQVFPSAEQRDLIANTYGAIEGGRQTLERLAALLAEMA